MIYVSISAKNNDVLSPSVWRIKNLHLLEIALYLLRPHFLASQDLRYVFWLISLRYPAIRAFPVFSNFCLRLPKFHLLNVNGVQKPLLLGFWRVSIDAATAATEKYALLTVDLPTCS